MEFSYTEIYRKGGKSYPGAGTKDSCYKEAKQKYDVFPSAYASGYISKCRKAKQSKKAKGGTFDKENKEGLRGWFSRNDGKGWVDCNTGKPCGRQKGEKRGYPSCRPTKSDCKDFKVPKKKSPKGKSPEYKKWEKKELGGLLFKKGGSVKANMRCGETRRSNRPGKKIMKKYCIDGKEKLVHAGAKGYSDYRKHKDSKRRKNFHSRHNCDTAKKGTPRHLACTELWEQGGLLVLSDLLRVPR